jgi:hypothetical protein
LLFATPCSAQTVNSQSKASNNQSAEIREAKIGHSCTFRGVNDVETYSNCVLQDGQGNLFVAPDYVKKIRFDSYHLAAIWDDDDPYHKFMYVDPKGRVVLRGVPISDNWATEFSDGLVQTVINEKIGFADMERLS